jgi:ectoine hydroxylase-related dioxygenase (phytanoyl-CoA dioxygenase family)
MGARRRLSASLAHLDPASSPSTSAPRAGPAAAALAGDSEAEAPGYAHREYSPEEVEAFVEQVSTQGWVVLPECIEPELVPKLIAASDRLMATEGDGLGKMLGNQALNSFAVGKDPVYWELLDNANFLAVARRILGDDFLLSSSQTRNVHPGCSEQGFHTDDGLYRYTPELRELFPRPQRVQLSLVAGVALADFTETNGATVIFPGSHEWREDPQEIVPVALVDPRLKDPIPPGNIALREWAKENKGVEPITATMKTGSVVIWAGGTWHGGGAFTDDDATEDRTSVLFNCTRGIFRTQENVMVQLPHDTVAQMPPNVQRLVGYGRAGGLGHTDGKDPATLLGEGGAALVAENEEQLKRQQQLFVAKAKEAKAKAEAES